MTVKRILVPVDGSERSARAIEASVALAQQLGAAIVGFVVETKPTARTPAAPDRIGAIPTELDDDDDEPRSATQPVLAHFEEAARAAGVAFEGVVEQLPRVDKAIIAAAESQHCDLIVMVTRGRGAFGEFLFGSQTKAVLAGCKLPLLVLR